MTALRPLAARLARFLRREDGSATIEFALLVPAFLYFFMSTFELGMIMTRDVMLRRGVDMTVRDIRLGRFDTSDEQEMHDALKESICGFATLLPNCESEIKLEMRVVDPRAWAWIADAPNCIDRSDPDSGDVDNTFQPGRIANQLVVMRACYLVDPFFPQVGLGNVATQAGGYFTLLATTAYVIEPS